MEIRGIKKAHFHTKKDTLQRLGADLHVIQALQTYNKYLSNKPFAFLSAPLTEERCNYNSLIEYVTIRKLKG